MNLTNNRGWLADDAAASLHRVDARLGRALDINSAGRTNAEQWDAWRKYGSPRAAYPGTSTHEKGRSIDTDDRLAWIGEHGWVANVRNEPWHFEYFANKDQHRNAAPAFPLRSGYYFGPKSGPVYSVSGYFSHREDLRRWQARMAQRGWGITADGLYGDRTASIARAFQAEKGLTVDGKIGPATWAAAWTAAIT